jgi:hypothetical protein
MKLDRFWSSNGIRLLQRMVISFHTIRGLDGNNGWVYVQSVDRVNVTGFWFNDCGIGGDEKTSRFLLTNP